MKKTNPETYNSPIIDEHLDEITPVEPEYKPCLVAMISNIEMELSDVTVKTRTRISLKDNGEDEDNDGMADNQPAG